MVNFDLSPFVMDGQLDMLANIKLLNEEMAEEVNAMEMFDLMEINCAMVEKDMITITDLEIKRVLDKKGVKRAISGPLKGPNV